MKRKKHLFTTRMVSWILVFVFSISNTGWTGPILIPPDKLAVHSLAGDIVPAAVENYVDTALVRALLQIDTKRMHEIRGKGLKIPSELQEALRGLDVVPFSCGVLHAKDNSNAKGCYRFWLSRNTGQIVASRYGRSNEPADPLYTKILKSWVKYHEEIEIGREPFIHEIILVPEYLKEYILTLRFPGEYRGGLAKSLVYENSPVTEEEKEAVEKSVGKYESSDKAKEIEDDWINEIIETNLNKEQYQGLKGKVTFKTVPDLIITRRDGKKRVFPAYSKKVENPEPGKPEWIVYFSSTFCTFLSAGKLSDVMAMLVGHELDEITSGSCEAAEEKELKTRAITINGMQMSLLDAFIYFFYAEDLGCDNAGWWDELNRYIYSWLTWHRLRMIINAEGIDKTDRLREMGQDIARFIYPDFSKFKGLTIDTPSGTKDLWEYTLAVCNSLEHFENKDHGHFQKEIGKSNFNRLQEEIASVVFQDPKIKELFWLATIFFQVGKTIDPHLGRYYLEGKGIMEGLLRQYYEMMEHIPLAERERLIRLGSEFVYRYSDVRSIHMGDRTPDVLLKITGIEGLSDDDKNILLSMINIFTVLYAKDKASFIELDNSLVNRIFDNLKDVEVLKRYVATTDWLTGERGRLVTWFGEQKERDDFWTAFYDLIPGDEQERFQDFLKKINLFNCSPAVNSIREKMHGKGPEVREFYIKTLVKMFYFLMKLNQHAGKEWIVFAQRDLSEDMVNKFGRIEINDINYVLEEEKKNNYIDEDFKEGRKKIVLLGIPLYCEGNRLIVDIHRYGAGIGHGIEKMERNLKEAMKRPEESPDGRYYDLLVVVTDESSAPEMNGLVNEAKREGFIPEKARVVVVSQPYGIIGGNLSAMINLRCTKDRKYYVEEVPLGDYMKEHNVAVVLSAGAAKRNAPLTGYGFSDKGKMDGPNGKAYLKQTFRQLMYNYDPERKGVFVTTNDGTKCISQEVALGMQGFQIIGAAKPAMANGKYNQDDLGELGCMKVDLLGNVSKFVEKPDEATWEKEIGDEMVPTNWADYYLRPDFFDALKAYGDLMAEDGRPIYLARGLDTSKDFSEATIQYDRAAYQEKKVDEWLKIRQDMLAGEVLKQMETIRNDAGRIWDKAQELTEKFGIGFVDCGAEAFFMDTGTNLIYRNFLRGLAPDSNDGVEVRKRKKQLRRFLDITEERGWRIDEKKGLLIGPEVRIGKDVTLGRGCAIVGRVIIKEGKIGNGCVIENVIAREVKLADNSMAYGIYRPKGELKIRKGRHDCDWLVTELFLDIGKVKEAGKNTSGLEEVIFPNGRKAFKLVVGMPVEAKGNGEAYKFTVSKSDGGEMDVFVRDGKTAGANGRLGYPPGKNVKKITGNPKDKNLEYVDNGGEVKSLGRIIKCEGGSIWNFYMWPRESEMDGLLRVEERDPKGEKFSFAEILELPKFLLDKEAVDAFKKAFAVPGLVDLPKRRVRYGPHIDLPPVTEEEAELVLNFVNEQFKKLHVFQGNLSEAEQQTVLQLMLDETCITEGDFNRAINGEKRIEVLKSIAYSSFLNEWYLEKLQKEKKTFLPEDNFRRIKDIIKRAREFQNAVMAEERAWVKRNRPEFKDKNLVYITPEIKALGGLKSLTSGGLGVLAGELLVGFGDIGMNTYGCSFFYKKALLQRVDDSGNQELIEVPVDYSILPIKDTGKVVSISIGDKEVKARVWELREGHACVYLLDTDIPENEDEEIRNITTCFYKGESGSIERLMQYLVLGKGTIAAFNALDIPIDILHLNEPHSVVAAYEVWKEGLNTRIVFTTHTPIEDGLPKFNLEYTHLFDKDEAKVSGVFEKAGKLNLGIGALTLAGASNAVSKEHLEITRRGWASEFKDTMFAETNGVDTEFWQPPELQSPDWNEMTDEGLLEVKQRYKEELLAEVKKRTGVLLDKNVMTIVIARRITGFKNTSMILEDLERLKKIVNARHKEVQIIFAGNVHPRDRRGQDMLQKIKGVTKMDGFEGKIVFVPNYNVEFAKLAVRGADVWLCPSIPKDEASATSQDKALKSGTIVISSYTGAFIEHIKGLNLGFNPNDYDAENFDANGIFIKPYTKETLYEAIGNLQELYYYDNKRIWTHLMQNAIRTEVDIRDVARGYVNGPYYAAWYKKDFEEVSIDNMSPAPEKEIEAIVGDKPIEVTVEVILGDLSPDKVEVEIWYGPRVLPGEQWETIAMKAEKEIDKHEGKYLYKGFVPVPSMIKGKSETWFFTTRVRLKGIDVPGFIKWASIYEKDSSIRVVKQTPAGPWPRRVRKGESNVPLWQADIKEDGKIDKESIVVHSPRHEKLTQIDLNKYERARERLIKRYKGTGIFGAAKELKVVDNFEKKGVEDYAPSGEVVEGVITIDVDLFRESDDAFYAELEHKLRHTISDLVEENDVLDEVTAIYMSLNEALEQEIEGPGNLGDLGRESIFWVLLDKIKNIPEEKRTDAIIISYAIELLREIPYYRELFNKLGLVERKWIEAVKDAEEKVEAAIDVYNQLAGEEEAGASADVPERIKSKNIVNSVKRTERAVLRRIKTFNGKIRIAGLENLPKPIQRAFDVIREMIDRTEEIRNEANEALETKEERPKKYIWLDRDKENGLDKSTKSEWDKTKSDLKQNGFEFVYSRPSDVAREDIIRLVNLSDSFNERSEDTLYLSLPYNRVSLFSAAEVVLAGGDVERLKGTIALELITELYEQLLDRKITDDDLVKLFTQPWFILQEVRGVMEHLNSLEDATNKYGVAA